MFKLVPIHVNKLLKFGYTASSHLIDLGSFIYAKDQQSRVAISGAELHKELQSKRRQRWHKSQLPP